MSSSTLDPLVRLIARIVLSSLAFAALPSFAGTGTTAPANAPILRAARPGVSDTFDPSHNELRLDRDPDLIVGNLSIAQSGPKYRVSAELCNGGSWTNTYGGGGTLLLERSSGGVLPVDLPFATLAPAIELARVPILALAGGECARIAADSDVRGIFVVRAFSDEPGSVERPAVLPGPGAKSLSVANLIGRSVRVNDTMLSVATTSTLGAAQVRLDRDESYVRIPGLYEKTFRIATHVVPTFVKDAHYYIHDVNTTNLSRGFREGGLEICMDFETDDTELIGYVKTVLGDFDEAAPDGNADPFQVCLLVPVAFHGALLAFDDQEISVTSHVQWDFNGVLGDYIRNEYSSDINREIEGQFREMLSGNVGARLSAEFNDAIQSVVQGARITGYHLEDGALVIDIED
jgi:hypothetical protein